MYAMDMSSFFSSYPGTHIIQAFFHSLIAAVIVDRSIHAWSITDPRVRQRFRLIVILVPVFSYPLYQLINPERGSLPFRLSALFDSNRWLSLELWDMIPLSFVFALFLGTTAFIFIMQELIPILSHVAESRQSEMEWDHPQEGSPVLKAIENLEAGNVEVFIANDDDLLIYSTTGNNPAVFISSGLIEDLRPEDLRAAIAHELAHIRRSRRPLLILTYILRVLQFFSPATLVEFRRVVEDEEKICDDEAVALTGRPDALAEVLKKLRHGDEENSNSAGKNPSEMLRTIESMSHDMLLQRRIQRLVSGAGKSDGSGWVRFSITLAVVLILNYYVV